MAKLVQLNKTMTDAILTVVKYVRDATGDEPTQEELADAIKSYFILNEIGNQVKFQRKKKAPVEPTETASRDAFWTLNLMAGPSKNSLIRVGLFYKYVQDAIADARRFVKDATGKAASETEIAKSLMSTFIISEIKNQIDWQRNGQGKAETTLSLTE
jgi:hypothetical protein